MPSASDKMVVDVRTGIVEQCPQALSEARIAGMIMYNEPIANPLAAADWTEWCVATDLTYLQSLNHVSCGYVDGTDFACLVQGKLVVPNCGAGASVNTGYIETLSALCLVHAAPTPTATAVPTPVPVPVPSFTG